jgi:hypothetical protein
MRYAASGPPHRRRGACHLTRPFATSFPKTFNTLTVVVAALLRRGPALALEACRQGVKEQEKE